MRAITRHGIGKPQRSYRLGVKYFGPRIDSLEGFDLRIGYTASSRRDNMTAQSSRTLIDD